MKVSFVTKPNALTHPARARILNALKGDGSFELEECKTYPVVIADNTDVVLVFGGDGTVLDSVRAIGGRDIAVLGVNLGNLGFLTSYEQDVCDEEIVGALKSGKRVSRILLNVGLNGEQNMLALNEVVVRTSAPRPITLDVSVDGRFVDRIHSDGIIVSSPIGSTAYSLSAGGPVLAPDVEALVINPICAHSLHSRPLVVSATSAVSMKLVGDCGAAVTVDGKLMGYVSGVCESHSVEVTRSESTVKFISVDDDAFYSKLLQKMNRWGTTLR